MCYLERNTTEAAAAAYQLDDVNDCIGEVCQDNGFGIDVNPTGVWPLSPPPSAPPCLLSPLSSALAPQHPSARCPYPVAPQPAPLPLSRLPLEKKDSARPLASPVRLVPITPPRPGPGPCTPFSPLSPLSEQRGPSWAAVAAHRCAHAT